MYKGTLHTWCAALIGFSLSIKPTIDQASLGKNVEIRPADAGDPLTRVRAVTSMPV